MELTHEGNRMSFSAADVKKLRDETGAGMMDCKKALDEAQGDYQKALELVKQRGLAKAEKTADRETKEGYVGSYIHSNRKVGTLIEMLCETDFVARNDEFQKMVNDIAMHVTAMNPASVEELLAQEFIRNPEMTIEQMIKALSGKIGERFVLHRFTRYEVGSEE